MNESSSEQSNNKPWLFKKGQSGNPSGRPKGSISLKEYARKYLQTLSDEEKIEFMEGLPKDTVWKMAEGNPHSTESSKVEVTLPTPILGGITNEVHKDNSVGEDIEVKETT